MCYCTNYDFFFNSHVNYKNLQTNEASVTLFLSDDHTTWSQFSVTFHGVIGKIRPISPIIPLPKLADKLSPVLFLCGISRHKDCTNKGTKRYNTSPQNTHTHSPRGIWNHHQSASDNVATLMDKPILDFPLTRKEIKKRTSLFFCGVTAKIGA